MRRDRYRRLTALFFLAEISLASHQVLAQDGSRTLVPLGWNVGEVHVRAAARHKNGTRSANQHTSAAGFRGLTINRSAVPYSQSEDLNPLRDGPILYGDIRSFDPEPSVDSGTQLPFGLDGVGGFGSDLGFDAGEDASIYDRGP